MDPVSLSGSLMACDNPFLQVQPSELQAYAAIAELPWDVKPIYGLTTDSFAIAGYHRQPYIALAGEFLDLSHQGNCPSVCHKLASVSLHKIPSCLSLELFPKESPVGHCSERHSWRMYMGYMESSGPLYETPSGTR